MEPSLTNGWDLLIAVAYAAAACTVIFMLKHPISSFLSKNKVKISLPGSSEIEITPADAGWKISSILKEFMERYESLLNNYQKDLYRRIISKKAPISVKELIPDFDRNNPEHIGALRALRGIGLIVPENEGSWDEKSLIVVTKFGQEINTLLDRSF
jgi:hypothetical protein